MKTNTIIEVMKYKIANKLSKINVIVWYNAGFDQFILIESEESINRILKDSNSIWVKMGEL